MLIPFILCFFLSMAYAALMFAYRHGWEQQPVFKTNGSRPKTSISIIIPARNEEANIEACISSILAQNYPGDFFEVIVINDHSTDNTVSVVESFDHPNVRCIDLPLQQVEVIAFKKAALALGISKSRGELILTTDADCIAPAHWLKYIAAIYEEQKPVMIVAPVDFTSDGSLVQTFQSLDFMSMQGITAAVHRLKLGNMCNGANLAFSKEAYHTVDGYKDIDHLASGDDFLLMTKFQKNYPGRISYLKSPYAIVRTAPQPDWFSFFQQRIRWASKSGKYDDKKMTAMLAFVYLFNLSFLVLFVMAIFKPFFWFVLLLMLVFKTISEIYYLDPVAGFFGKAKQLRIFPLLQPLHIAYVISAGFLGMIGKYQWKGRAVR
ncbi:MAG TPA: glycosyltransferase [Flavipsychrobacter sp.]|nr:glycosyltransferase [Flavipsychrobacter sp.]